MRENTLTLLFEANRQALKKELNGLVLPQDATKIQTIVNNFFNKLFDSKGDYRQELSYAEDCILQVALSLLETQQRIGLMLSEKNAPHQERPAEKTAKSAEKQKKGGGMFLSQPISTTSAFIGAGGGALVGNVFGGWGAVIGSIVGTAIVTYIAYYKSNKTGKDAKRDVSVLDKDDKDFEGQPIDVDVFLEIVSDTCRSIDSLIATFRSQIQKVVNEYESQEKPTLEKTYGTLLESIQSLLGVAYSNRSDGERLRKIDGRIEQLVESMENHNFKVVKYVDDSKGLFEEFPSKNVDEPVMICPAITKNGKAVLSGKVFVKDNQD